MKKFIVILFVIANQAQASLNFETQRENAQRKLKAIQQNIIDTKNNLQTYNKLNEQYNNYIEKTDKEINFYSKQIFNIKNQLEKENNSLNNLHNDYKKINKHSKELQDSLQLNLKANYIISKKSPITFLLNNENPNDINRSLIYFKYINASQINDLKEKLEKLETIANLEVELKNKIKEIDSLKLTKKAHLNSLEQLKKERKEQLLSIKQEINKYKTNLTTLTEKEQSTQNLIKDYIHKVSLKRQTLDLNAFSKAKGELLWPLGGKPQFNNYKKSRIKSSRGDKVYSIYKGKIVFADWLKGFGLMVIIDHGGRYMSLYGHNESIFKEVGQVIEQGEIIGLVGESGGQSKPGLYFEIRKDGVPINPDQWFAKS